ncbi:MAG: Rdx family protein [Deltaproteobacteria bacterium]|nr:MAG: Rdx family protein [Deltaproteobacteria bacterium]
MAARIREAFGVEARLIRGDRGIFDVAVDGTIIYSKHATGRFPEPEEVLSALRERR